MGMLRETALKYKEQLLYIIFGVATTLVNWIIYTLALLIFTLAVSNAIAWFLAVLFAFIVNKKYVFESKYVSVKQSLREVALFYGARIFSGFVEILGLPFLVFIGLNQEIFGIEGAVAKAIISVVVILMNYFFSKFVVFKRKEQNDTDA